MLVKVIIPKSCGEVSLLESDTIEYLSYSIKSSTVIFLDKNLQFSYLHFMQLFSGDPTTEMHQGLKGKDGGAAAPPDFGRSESAAGQRRRAALLQAPSSSILTLATSL